MTDDALATALWSLYGVEPAQFVATRTRLARELKAVDPELAATLAKARRPQAAAAALNQLVREYPQTWSDLLGQAADLRAAQRRAHDASALREVAAARRTWCADVLALCPQVSASVRSQLEPTLMAAVADDEALQALGSGILAALPQAATPAVFGIDVVPPGLALVPEVAAEPEDAERARQVRLVLQSRVDELAGQLKALQAERVTAIRALDTAHRHLAQAQAAVQQAQQHLDVVAQRHDVTQAQHEQALAQYQAEG